MTRKTAGLLVYHNDKILLVRQRATLKYSIPKGEIKENESTLEAAIRETYEETGLLIPVQYIESHMYICSIRIEQYDRRLFYYKVYLPASYNIILKNTDKEEIQSAHFYSINAAISIIQISQVAILWDGGHHLDRRITDLLVKAGWISYDIHPCTNLYIYNYTEKCKREQVWNEVTMWCRGLIVNKNGNIAVRQLKKFFEYHQLYPECRPTYKDFEVSEKIDGFLGITYWIDGCPYISTRDSFCSYPAQCGTSLLYSKYPEEIGKMNPMYSYLFEIVFPNDYLVLDYGNMEELFLIDIIENQTGKSVLGIHEPLSFPIIRQYDSKYGLEHYLSINKKNKEGFVVKFADGNRIKIKFPWFKNEFMKKHGKADL